MKNPMPRSRALPALALAAVLVSTAACAQQSATPSTSADAPRQRLDANGDGAIDRAEAAKFPRLAENFDKLDRNGDGKLDAGERPQHRGDRRGKDHRGHGGPGRHGGIAALDRDGDGRISKAELEAGTGRDGRPHRLVEHFAAIDTNKDGHLVRGEVAAWHERQRPQREAEMRKRFDGKFAEADLNKDGKLSRIEVDEKMPRLAKRFAWMDDNRDGFLSRAELEPRRHR